MYLRSGPPARWGGHRDGRRTRLQGVETRAQSNTLLSSGQINGHEEITVILIEATDGTRRSDTCIGPTTAAAHPLSCCAVIVMHHRRVRYSFGGATRREANDDTRPSSVPVVRGRLARSRGVGTGAVVGGDQLSFSRSEPQTAGTPALAAPHLEEESPPKRCRRPRTSALAGLPCERSETPRCHRSPPRASCFSAFLIHTGRGDVNASDSPMQISADYQTAPAADSAAASPTYPA